MARQPEPSSVLVIGCGALARELLDVVSMNRIANVRVECLPAILHNRPEKIPGAVRSRIERATGYDRIFVAYGDCGTGGRLDAVLDEYGIERLPGAHCYQFFAGAANFDSMHEAELGTLYLTDYLARHFERLIWEGLGLNRWPELLTDYFGHYTRVLHIAQSDDPSREADARAAADRLGLRYERQLVGYGELEPTLIQISKGREAVPA